MITLPNSPAFPSDSGLVQNGKVKHHNGLTKREHFALMALNGVLVLSQNISTPEQIAKDSISIADALINELNKSNG